MVEDRIGYRYAKSLFELAQEKDVLEAAKDDMQMIWEACRDSKDLSLFLKSPLVYASKKQTVLDAVFGGKFKGPFTQNLVNILVRKGREMYLPYVAKAFLELYDAANKIIRGVLTTAVPISDAQYTQIKEAIETKTGAQFEVDKEVNEELVGGFTLKIGDQLFDGSVASSIRRIKRELLNK